MSSVSLLSPTSSPSDRQARELICELCRNFYSHGWFSGTGGGISIRSGDRIFMAPSGVQKEKLRPEDIFVVDSSGDIVEKPLAPFLNVSACRPLFLHAYNLRQAGAVLHSHSLNAMIATELYADVFRITDVEMMKGIKDGGVFELLEVPIIENTAHECDLADAMKEAMLAFPKSFAVLVRGHGVYVWGADWVQAKTHAESYDYLFAAAVRLKQLGIDPTKSRRKSS
jgi:methylthioribulose-1-phosphate dehydratase